MLFRSWIALEMLYSSAFSSRMVMQSACDARQFAAISTPVSAWVERSEGKISAVLLFRRTGVLVQVLNEVIHVEASLLDRFAQAVFRRDPQARMVRLHAICLDNGTVQVPMMRSVFSEDYVLDLPPDHERWMASLSRQTREKIRYHLRRSFRRQPGLSFNVTHAAGIADSEVRAVLDLNRQRMQRKGKVYGMSETDEQQLCEQMKVNGWLCALRLDGEICAGLLCSVVGSEVTMHVIAHDPRHDDLRLGLLCCCLSIRHAIEQRMTRFHFLWGHYDYKRKLGGQPWPLCRVLLLRSAWELLRHPLLSAGWLSLAASDALRRWHTRRLASKTDRPSKEQTC